MLDCFLVCCVVEVQSMLYGGDIKGFAYAPGLDLALGNGCEISSLTIR